VISVASCSKSLCTAGDQNLVLRGIRILFFCENFLVVVLVLVLEDAGWGGFDGSTELAEVLNSAEWLRLCCAVSSSVTR
jgi:hypothetical protein